MGMEKRKKKKNLCGANGKYHKFYIIYGVFSKFLGAIDPAPSFWGTLVIRREVQRFVGWPRIL